MKQKTVWILGGDARYLILRDLLADRGYRTLSAYHKTADRLAGTPDVAILPYPATKDGKTLFAPDFPLPPPTLTAATESFRPDTLVLTGGKADCIREKAKNGIVIDYAADRRFLRKNGILTAEGAIAYLSKTLDKPITQTTFAVLGYGNVAAPLAGMLASFSPYVCVAARCFKTKNETKTPGVETIPLADFLAAPPPVDVICNTIPAPILTPDIVQKIHPHTGYLELATAPGAVVGPPPPHYAVASGIPAKYSPTGAAAILAETVDRIIREANQ